MQKQKHKNVFENTQEVQNVPKMSCFQHNSLLGFEGEKKANKLISQNVVFCFEITMMQMGCVLSLFSDCMDSESEKNI